MLLKSGLGLRVPSLPQTQPRHLPVRIRSAACVGKALLQFPVRIDGLVIVGLEQIEIARREQRLLQPQAGGRALPKLTQVAQETIFVAAAARDLSQVVEPLRVDVRRGALQSIQDLLRVLVLTRFVQSDRQCELDIRAIARTRHRDQIAILVGGIAEALALGQQIGPRSAPVQSERRHLRGRSQLLQLNICLAGFRAQRHGDVQIAQDFGRLRWLPRGGIGAPKREFEIGPLRLPVFLENCDRVLRTVFRQQSDAIQNAGIPQQQRLGILLIEIARVVTASAVFPL